MDTNQFGAAFWLTLSGLVISSMGAACYYALKSKCTNFSLCWGMVVVTRDVLAENNQEQMELEKGIMPPTLNK
jgi:hypothetical protein